MNHNPQVAERIRTLNNNISWVRRLAHCPEEDGWVFVGAKEDSFASQLITLYTRELEHLTKGDEK